LAGEHPNDIKANITVTDESIYPRHVVKSGESLSKIAKHYYGDPRKYKQLFSANTNILKNPDKFIQIWYL
jgi:nucleoid-associated protein YgaU